VRHVLSRACRPVLEALAGRTSLFAFDFDGTLAPIVDDRDAAAMRPETRRLLVALSTVAPCAVLSGRGLGDLGARVEGVPLVLAVGNHGAEWGDEADGAPARRQMRELQAALEPVADRFTGVSIEDKGLSLTVHFRGADAAQAEHAVLSALDRPGGPRIVLGKRVVNVVPAGAPHKGVALTEMIARAGCDAAMYVGDDVTDEDAFRDPGVSPFVSIRVGESDASLAKYFLRDQTEIDALLRVLLDLVAPRARAGGTAR
jgi:trehalose 6-phosphate phosphatase